MTYLPGFTSDIFISYVHANNDRGWVTQFHERLQRALDNFIEDVSIWRDERGLNSNTRFDAEIEKQIKGSAIFVAIVSKRYLNPDGYCRKELSMFHNHAQADRYGLSIENQNRIFNVLYHNIPFNEWPEELGGITARKFHDESGFPLEGAERDFEFQLRRLTHELVQSIETFKKAISASAPAASVKNWRGVDQAWMRDGPVNETLSNKKNAVTVFLASASSTLEAQQERIINELRRHDVGVIANVPPPFEAGKHDERVKEALAEAHLSVHLLNEAPGPNIYDLPEVGDDGQPLRKGYAQRQVELGFKHARNQLIWLPPEMKIESIENERHQKFLADLETQEHSAATRIIREPKSDLARVILDSIKEIKETTRITPMSAALLNYHHKDRREARELEGFLEQHGVLPLTQQEMDDPKLTLMNLEEHIKKVNRLIFVYGAVERDWVEGRLWESLKMASIRECLPKAFGVYFVSPRRKHVDGNFKLPVQIPICEFDSQDIANPQSLRPLLEAA